MDDKEHVEMLLEVAETKEEERNALLEGKVRCWVVLAKGKFRLTDMFKEMGIISSEDIFSAKFAIQTLEFEGKIKADKINGVYVKTDIALEKMKKVENRTPPIELWLPLGLHKKVVTIRGSLIIIAGVTNAGKSAFFLNFTEQNMNNYKIRYVSSEWSNEERDIQLEDFGADIDEWDEKVDFYAKKDITASFDNYVDPENITIIDYFESYDDYAGVSGALRDIADRLTTGIAIVALQKKSGMAHGYGGEGTANRAQLYINIDKHELDYRKRIATIRKLKKAKDRKYSIEHLSCEFEYDHKGRIVEQTDWGKVIEVKKKGELLEKYIQSEKWANQEEEEVIEWTQ
jgi:KaiC/GvpD/RAD55 family RecA-like ATPase